MRLEHAWRYRPLFQTACVPYSMLRQQLLFAKPIAAWDIMYLTLGVALV